MPAPHIVWVEGVGGEKREGGKKERRAGTPAERPRLLVLSPKWKSCGRLKRTE